MNAQQHKLLDIILWIDGFCSENNIRYFLIGGTELGAIRHNGFIPWDDDADIGMPRKDYLKFIELSKGKLFKDKYFVESPYYSEDDFYYPVCKVFDLSTTLIENTRQKFVRGIYVDVFPLDGLGDTIKEAKCFFNNCYKKNMPASLAMMAVRKERKWYKNFIVKISHLFFQPSKEVLVKNDLRCAKHDFDKTAYIGNIHGAWAFRETVKRETFGIGTRVLFEGHLLIGVDKPDDYLQSLYGDYMSMPPIEKRKSHHDYILLDIEKSFAENEFYNGYWKGHC